jgi:hypothetical protein
MMMTGLRACVDIILALTLHIAGMMALDDVDGRPDDDVVS